MKRGLLGIQFVYIDLLDVFFSDESHANSGDYSPSLLRRKPRLFNNSKIKYNLAIIISMLSSKMVI